MEHEIVYNTFIQITVLPAIKAADFNIFSILEKCYMHMLLVLEVRLLSKSAIQVNSIYIVIVCLCLHSIATVFFPFEIEGAAFICVRLILREVR